MLEAVMDVRAQVRGGGHAWELAQLGCETEQSEEVSTQGCSLLWCVRACWVRSVHWGPEA